MANTYDGEKIVNSAKERFFSLGRPWTYALPNDRGLYNGQWIRTAKTTVASLGSNGETIYTPGVMVSAPAIECSHFVRQALLAAGYKVSYGTSTFFNHLLGVGQLDNTQLESYTLWSEKYQTVSSNEVQKGDVVVFDGHVGIVLKYDPKTGDGLYEGAQSSGLSNEVKFSTNPGSKEFWGATKHCNGFVRVKDEAYDPDAAQKILNQIDANVNGALFINDPNRQLYFEGITPSPNPFSRSEYGGGNGDSDITYQYQIDENGKSIGDTWISSEGSSGTDTYNTDGLIDKSDWIDSNGTKYQRSYEYSGRVLTSEVWSASDGSSGDYQYNEDGSGSAHFVNADHTQMSYTYDTEGNIAVNFYNANGQNTETIWSTIEGAFGDSLLDPTNGTVTTTITNPDGSTIGTVTTDNFVANYSNGAFQGFTTINGASVSAGFNNQFIENLHNQGIDTPTAEDLSRLSGNLGENASDTDIAIKAVYDSTMENAVSGTDDFGHPILLTQSEYTIKTVSLSIASISDALSLIRSIQSGQPLPILATGLRLANDIDLLNGGGRSLELGAASSVASSVLSLYSLANALENGDSIAAVTSASYAVYGAAQAALYLQSSGLISDVSSTAAGAISETLGTALPYLSLVNSIAHGDYVGAAVSVASYWVPYVGWAYAVYSIVKSLFGHHDSIPDPWGNGQYVWNGNSITYQSAGQTGGQEAVNNVMNNVLSVLNNLIEKERQTNPTSALGIIPNRMPTIAYDMSGYRYTDIDPLTGEEKHAYLRFDTSGNPYNATPGSTESYQSIIEAMVRSALTRSAIAPLWEVQTAKMQTDAGDPKAGLTEEARAGRDGELAPAVTGDTQAFRPVTLDLSGNGQIDVISKDASTVNFDVDDSGYLKKTAWIDGGDAFLTLDRDYNGETNTGKEMFSNAAVALGRRGLAGMAWVDANYDGKITSADPVWNELRIWQDVNEDGVEIDAESHKLSDLGITELNYAMGTFTQNGVVKKLSSQDLIADTEGSKISVVPEGIIVETSKGEISLLVTRIDDQTAVEANQDGISGYEDVEMIIASADLLANDKLGGISGKDLSLTGLSNFKHGTGFVDVNGFVHFIPEADYAGSDAGFSYTTTAQNGQSGTGEVKITLQNVNDAPTLDHVEHETVPVYGYEPFKYYRDDGSYISGGEPIYTGTTPIAYEDTGRGKVIGLDIDDPADSLTYELVNGPQYGSVSIDAQGNFVYASWKEPGVESDRIVFNGEYVAVKDGNIYTKEDLPSQAVYPTSDVFQVKITDPHGATTIQSITVPHYGPYLPPTPTPPGGGGGKKPIAVDLNGDGFNFVNVSDSNVFFDVTGDGWKRKTAWVGADDGILAFDSDNNGKIEKASEISFVGYKESAQTDLEGLKAFDTNGDGKFSAQDEKWNQFGIWQDANQNGITDEGEFKKLSDLGIESIGLSSDGKFTVVNKQTVHGVGSMTKSDGTSLAIADVTLEYSAETKIPGTNTSVTPTSPFSADGEELNGTEDKDLILGKNGNNIVNAYGGDDVIFEDGGNDIIYAGDGNDVVYSGDDNDLAFGEAGNDIVYAGKGDDIVLAGDGNDVVFADLGNDIVFGDEGNDFISGGFGNDVLSGDTGNDELYGESGNDALFGGDGDDKIVGLDGYDRLDGGAGDDMLDGGADEDEMIGGVGNDTYVVDNIADVVTELLNEGTDTVNTSIDYTLGTNLENLTLLGDKNLHGIGNELDNNLLGNSGNNILEGKEGNDTLNGGLGADRMIGGLGDDLYYVDNSGDAVIEAAGEGNDTIYTSVNYKIADNVEKLVLTGYEAINATGNDVSNILVGNSASNILDGGLGADAMSGGKGDDTYIVDNANDTVTELANAGIDTIKASVSWTLTDNTENLFLTGNEAINATGNTLNNILVGNSATNILDGGLGADVMAGGIGNDIYYVDNAADSVVEKLSEGTDQVIAKVSYSLSDNVENLTLEGDQSLNATGNALDNILVGNSANNILDGKAGIDTMLGGLGDDIYYVDNSNDTVVENVNEGYDTIRSSVTYTASANVERLELLGSDTINAYGNELGNTLVGNSAANILDGGLGADIMLGEAGDDTYYVDNVADSIVEKLSEGTDQVIASVSTTLSDNVENLTLRGDQSINAIGNELANILIGNSAANILDGKAGADTMLGGLGDDIYYVDNSNDTVVENTNEGYDTIRSSVTYTASANVERLELLGEESINAYGNELSNVLLGNNASNILDGKEGIDTLVGKEGDDTYYVDNTEDHIIENLNEGTDNVIASASYSLSDNVENLTLVGSENLQGDGNSLDNTLVGNLGNNILDGKAGSDTMLGGLGDDLYYVEAINDTVIENVNEGYDTIRSSVTYTASANVERLELIGEESINAYGNELDNVLVGNSASNILDGKAGADTMIGGKGDDLYYVDHTSDSIVEMQAEGIDSVISSVSYTLSNNVENLTLVGDHAQSATGNDLDNTIQGNALDNIIDGKAGVDTMLGAQGNDSYYVDSEQDKVIENYNEGIDTIYSTVSYVLPENVENLIMIGDGSINAGGNSANNTLIGNDADNYIFGGAGDDYIDGKGGNDTLEGGTGNDTLLGGVGNDTFIYNLGDGLDTIIETQGNDTVKFTQGLSLDNVALRIVNINGILTAQVRILNEGGCEQPDQGFNFEVTQDKYGHLVSPIEHFTFADGSSKTLDDLLIKTQITYATPWQTTVQTGRNDDIIYGNCRSNVIYAGTGNDSVYAYSGGDTIYGEGGNDYLYGDIGNDTLYGGCGTDILSGASGNDTLKDVSGNNIFLGGSGKDIIEAGSGNDFIAGGTWDDMLNGGAGYNVFAFNHGDGYDTILPAQGAHNTLSLSGVDLDDIKLSKKGDDLIFNMGCNSQVTLKNWYTSEENQNFDTLQMVSSTYEYNFGFLHVGITEKPDVETFDFHALVEAFDEARTANPRLNSWNAMNGLLDAHLSSSDSAALGGDLAWNYAKSGDLSNVALASAQTILQNPSLGASAQAINTQDLCHY
jgi:Ca2+-binding RTX toxin-like protein